MVANIGVELRVCVLLSRRLLIADRFKDDDDDDDKQSTNKAERVSQINPIQLNVAERLGRGLQDGISFTVTDIIAQRDRLSFGPAFTSITVLCSSGLGEVESERGF